MCHELGHAHGTWRDARIMVRRLDGGEIPHSGGGTLLAWGRSRMKPSRLVGTIVLGLLAPLACAGFGTKECTEIGCMDGAHLTVKTSDGTWPYGIYELEV